MSIGQEATFDALRADLVTANHILAAEKILDAFGHVSVRATTDKFLLARSMAPALVTAQDILSFDFEAVETEGDVRPSYLERFIHAAIYRARPDVHAIVHSHSWVTIPFGIARREKLRPVYHMSSFLGAGAPVFDIRTAGGDATDMLIRNLPLGDALAQTLGNESVVLMRGHGVTIVGANLRQAVFRAIYTEVSARIQTAAMGMGEVTYLNAAEAEAATIANNTQVDRAWDLWRRNLSH